jgi:ABC-type multidrug transport system, permease component
MIKIFIKDLKLFLKDKRAMLLTFLLPIILISLFSFAFGGIDSNKSKPRPIQLIITDMDKSAVSQKIVSKFDSIKSLEITQMDLNQAKTEVNKGKYIGVLAIYKGFEDSLKSQRNLPLELFFDRAQEMQVGLIRPVLINLVMQLKAESFFHKQSPMTVSPTVKKRIEPQVTMTSLVGEQKDTNLFLIQSIAGVAIMMLLFSISGLSAGLLDEKESGTLKRLLYSPLNPADILFGKILTSVAISIAQLTIMFLFAGMAFGLHVSQNIPALVMMVISVAIAVSGIGILLASIAKTRAQASGLGTLTILTMSAIGGSMVPIFAMPAIMQKIAMFSVNYWGIQGFYDIFWRNLPTLEILPRALVLVAMGVGFIAISIRLFNKNMASLS